MTTEEVQWFVHPLEEKQVFMCEGQRYETDVWTVGGKPALFDRERLASKGVYEVDGYRPATADEIANGTSAHDPDTVSFDRAKMEILS